MKTISQEMIKYQNSDTFPQKLTEKIEYIYKEIENNIFMDNKTLIEKSGYIKEVQTLICNRFNMNIVFDKELHVFYPAAIIPFFSDYLSDLSSMKNIGSDKFSAIFKFNDVFKHVNEIEKEKKAILTKLHNRKGYVDLKNARVGGYLSEIKHYLIIDFFALREQEIVPSELTAIILHEIGHAFGGLEYHHKLETTNSTIADVLNEMNNNNHDKAVYIFKKHFSQKEFEDISVSDSKEINDFYGKVALAYLGEIKTQMANSKYDETNFENLADSFAARFNMGKDLVSGLNKLNRRYGLVHENNRMTFSILLFIDLLLNIIFLALFKVPGAIVMMAILITLYNSDNSNMTYDFPLERYNRVKNSIINNLKNINLPDELVKDLLSQFIFINEVIEKSMYFKDVKGRIADILLSSNRNNNYYISLQQSIENNLNNLLFVKAAQISIIK